MSTLIGSRSQPVSSGRTTSGTLRSNGATQYASDASLSSLAVASGDTLTVLASGTTVSMTVRSGGYEDVSNGGSTTGTAQLGRGTRVVSADGVAGFGERHLL